MGRGGNDGSADAGSDGGQTEGELLFHLLILQKNDPKKRSAGAGQNPTQEEAEKSKTITDIDNLVTVTKNRALAGLFQARKTY